MPQETRNERQLPAVLDGLSRGSRKGPGRGRARAMFGVRRRDSHRHGQRASGRSQKDPGVRGRRVANSSVARTHSAECHADATEHADAATSRDAAAVAPDTSYTMATGADRVAAAGSSGSNAGGICAGADAGLRSGLHSASSRASHSARSGATCAGCVRLDARSNTSCKTDRVAGNSGVAKTGARSVDFHSGSGRSLDPCTR